MIFGWVLTLILSVGFVVMGIFMLMGKGGFLIAGYNTMSKEEKEKANFDEKALCRFMGKMIIPIGIMTPFTMFKSILNWYIWVYMAVIIGLCLFAVIYINTGNRFKKK